MSQKIETIIIFPQNIRNGTPQNISPWAKGCVCILTSEKVEAHQIHSECFKIRLKNLFFVTCNVAAVVDLFRYGYVYSGAEEQFLSGEGSDTY